MRYLNFIFEHLRIRSRTLYNYYFFEKLGIPPVKREKISKSLIKPLLGKMPIIIDCGAHDGADSVDLARILGGTVHAFEPVPQIFERLKRRAAGHRVHCHDVALSDSNGQAEFHISGGDSDASSSLLKPKEHIGDHPTVTFDKTICVKTVTLDHWAQSLGIERVDLLWLDMQGAELLMLKASETILPTVSAIHTEVSMKETYEGVATYPVLREFLENQGFSVYREAIPRGTDMGNVLFVRS